VAVAASRAQAKSSPLYSPDWDLVDAVLEEKVSLYDLDSGELPQGLRELSFEELYLHIEALRLEREAMQQKIAELGRQRAEFIARQVEEKGIDDSSAFDGVIRQVIRKKAAEKGFAFPE
jgi:hypothetical protein